MEVFFSSLDPPRRYPADPWKKSHAQECYDQCSQSSVICISSACDSFPLRCYLTRVGRHHLHQSLNLHKILPRSLKALLSYRWQVSLVANLTGFKSVSMLLEDQLPELLKLVPF